jgi:hypothetical protein
MYSIYFMKIETHPKLSFHWSDFWPPIRLASTTYTKDGAKRHHNFRHFRHFEILGTFTNTFNLAQENSYAQQKTN